VIERGPAAGFRDPAGSVWLRVCRFENFGGCVQRFTSVLIR
jgi:hypothetical protein